MIIRILSKSIPTTFRLFLGIIFLIYGMVKLVFGQFGEPTPEIAALHSEGFVLAWTFFGYSRLYELFIGVGEVAAGILIMIPRTAALGTAIYFPIALNVMLVNYCYSIGVQDLSTVLTVLCLVLLWIYRRKYMVLLERG
ncbi:hypothetical protein [Paenibacillus senegalensis]|uniref:hypothetical protein n=1 Tax=Paenibacillus senegalensis TaxID=1465766 RepID=UPI0002897C21|nr:hypothetical protein [Paenibacillus senegalensis]